MSAKGCAVGNDIRSGCGCVLVAIAIGLILGWPIWVGALADFLGRIAR